LSGSQRLFGHPVCVHIYTNVQARNVIHAIKHTEQAITLKPSRTYDDDNDDDDNPRTGHGGSEEE
jgi:hypothetical protein